MPFLRDGTDTVFVFPAGLLRGTQWLVQLAVCRSPCCGCLKCEVFWLPVVATDTADEPRRFWLDLEARGLERPPTGEDAAFAAAFLAQATAADWGCLLAQFRAAKQELYEKTDLTTLDADFPFARIEDEGLLVGYDEIFPFHLPLRPVLGGAPFLVVDSYCVRLDCDCDEVSLAFCLEDPSDDDGQTTASECLRAFLDLRQRRWKHVVPRGRAPLPPQALLAEFLAQVDAYAIFPERRRVLRALYRHNRGKFVTMPIKAPDKTGRNDPCPCGSGRKYKKCCMGKAT